jgi:hypothetical protein
MSSNTPTSHNYISTQSYIYTIFFNTNMTPQQLTPFRSSSMGSNLSGATLVDNANKSVHFDEEVEVICPCGISGHCQYHPALPHDHFLKAGRRAPKGYRKVVQETLQHYGRKILTKSPEFRHVRQPPNMVGTATEPSMMTGVPSTTTRQDSALRRREAELREQEEASERRFFESRASAWFANFKILNNLL